MLSAYPMYQAEQVKQEALDDIEWVKQFILVIRNIRGEMDLSPNKTLPVFVKQLSEQDQQRLSNNKSFLMALAKLESIDILADNDKAPASATGLVGKMEVLIPMAGLINKEAELTRLQKAIEKATKEVQRVSGKLSNEKFVANAPEQVIAKEKAKQEQQEQILAKLQQQYEQIKAL